MKMVTVILPITTSSDSFIGADAAVVLLDERDMAQIHQRLTFNNMISAVDSAFYQVEYWSSLTLIELPPEARFRKFKKRLKDYIIMAPAPNFEEGGPLIIDKDLNPLDVGHYCKSDVHIMAITSTSGIHWRTFVGDVRVETHTFSLACLSVIDHTLAGRYERLRTEARRSKRKK
jgi:hypothetical protein